MDQGAKDLGAGLQAVSQSEWRAAVERELKGAPFDKRLVTTTDDGLRIEPLFTAEGEREADAAGYPGAAPYTRGGAALGTRGGWELRQRVASPELAAATAAIRGELERGTAALWIELNPCARAGYDADADVGTCGGADAGQGVLVSTVDQLEQLLDGVDLSTVRISIDAGGAALPAAALLLALARRRGVNAELLAAGSFNADPLGALAADGRLHAALDGSLRQLADLASWTAKHAPSWRAATVSTLPYSDAGATPVQQLAFALATGCEYLRTLTDAGMSLADAARQIGFRFAVGRDVFQEIAKLRAARTLWSRVVEASGGDAEAQRMVLHACTAERTKTARDPWVNLLRGTVEGFAAAAAGADAITILPHDVAIGSSDAFSQQLARNTQLVLLHEAYLDQVIDPAGGSWYVESLTSGLAEAAWALFQQIEGEGGMKRALRHGVIEKLVAPMAAKRRKALATRKLPLTGVSEYAHLDEQPLSVVVANADALRGQAAVELAAHRESTDQTQAVAELAQLATSKEPELGALTEAAIASAERGATLGAIAATLRGTALRARVERLQPWRDAEDFERLRDASDAYQKLNGKRPRVFLANLGPIPQHLARAEFAANALRAVGLEPVSNDGFESVERAEGAFAEAQADGAVICSTDEDYLQRAEGLAAALKSRGASFVLLAGRPGEHEKRYREAGIDAFIHLGSNIEQTFAAIWQQLGVPL